MKINIRNNIILFNILIFIVSTFLCGCNDKSELSEIRIVMGMGIDKISGDEPFLVTLEVINPKKNKSDDPEKEKKSTLEVSTGKSVFDAIQNFSKIDSLIMDFSHAKVIILSKELCESGVSEVMDYFYRCRQLRSTDWMLVANKTAKEILESRMDNEDITSEGIDDMMTRFKRNPSIIPVNLNDFIIKSESESKSSFTPVIDVEKSKDNSLGKIKIEQTAIFKNNSLLGVLTDEESKSLLWLSDNSKGHIVILPFKSSEHNENLTVEVFKKSSKIIPYITMNEVHFEIECTGDAVIRQIQNINMDTEMIGKIESNTESILKSQLNELINKSQKDFNSDFLGFSDKIHNNNPKVWFLMKEDWNEIYPNIKYEINLKITLTNIGMIKKSLTPNNKE